MPQAENGEKHGEQLNFLRQVIEKDQKQCTDQFLWIYDYTQPQVALYRGILESIA